VVDKILGQIRPEREEYIHDDVRSPNFGIFLSEFIQANDNESLSDNHVPSSLRRRFRITFKAEETEPPVKLRQIRASSIGHLVNFRVSTSQCNYKRCLYKSLQGICTRISDVKPLMEVACFTCDVCDQATYQVQSFSSVE
jgi:DNA replication licensing factor MCM7